MDDWKTTQALFLSVVVCEDWKLTHGFVFEFSKQIRERKAAVRVDGAMEIANNDD
jgi:hypothetical protein